MKIAIVVAMSKELALLLPIIENHSAVNVNGITFHTGHIGGHEVVVTQSGIAKVNAAIGTLTIIDTFHPGVLINTGVAGGTGSDAGILDVVVADKVAHHDVWCGFNTRHGQVDGCPATFDCQLPDSIFEGLSVKRGLVASGEFFVSTREEVNKILSVWPEAVAVDMEAAAIAQVCWIKNVPLICVKVVSDTPGAADNISQYENFWTDAPTRTFEILTSILKRI